MKKTLNFTLFILPFIYIGMSFGAKFLSDNPYVKSPFLMQGVVLLLVILRGLFTKGKTKIYTSEEYDKRGKIEPFEFETEKQPKP